MRTADVRRSITLTVNGQEQQVDVKPHAALLDVLRDELGLTGTKEGCGHGACGACTVLVNGQALCSCLVLAVEADGQQVTTIEGLAKNGTLDRLQQAFVDNGAVQCGFCAPGLILSATALLATTPRPTAADVRRGIAGNLCRCTGYVKVIEAVLQAAGDRGAPRVPRGAPNVGGVGAMSGPPRR